MVAPGGRFFFRLSTGAAAALALFLAPCALPAQSRFEAEIQRMLERDKASPPPPRGILFTGSSIFRLWSGLSEQMAPLPVFNRAFGGSRTQDLIDQFDRVVAPYEPRIIVYYCGSNDVNAGTDAGTILANTKRFLDLVRERLPGTVVYYTAIQKAPDKRARWDVVDAVNREMERYAAQTSGVEFIDLNPVLFRGGALREDLFLPDQLHFRPESTAYAEFAAVIKPVLMQAWEKMQ